MSDESRRSTDEALHEGPWPPAGFLREESLTPSEASAIEQRLLAEQPTLGRGAWVRALAVAAALLLAAGISLLLTRSLPRETVPWREVTAPETTSILRISRTDQPDRPDYVLEISYRPASRFVAREVTP